MSWRVCRDDRYIAGAVNRSIIRYGTFMDNRNQGKRSKTIIKSICSQTPFISGQQSVTMVKQRILSALRMGKANFTILEVSEPFFIEFRQMERKNRNLQQSDWRHRELRICRETLYKRAFRVPKSVEKLIFDAEQRELLNKAIAALPEVQRDMQFHNRLISECSL